MRRRQQIQAANEAMQAAVVNNAVLESVQTPQPVKRKGGRPKGSRNRPKQ